MGDPTDAGPWRWAIIRADDLNATERHVALALAVRMDADGAIPPKFAVGARRLAVDCARRPETVSKALRRLTSLGYLEAKPRGSGLPVDYRATAPRRGGTPQEGPPPVEGAPLPPEEGSVPPPVEDATAPRTGGTTTDVPPSPPSSTIDDDAPDIASRIATRLQIPLDLTAVNDHATAVLALGWHPDQLVDHLADVYEAADRRDRITNPSGWLLSVLKNRPAPSPNGPRQRQHLGPTRPPSGDVDYRAGWNGATASRASPPEVGSPEWEARRRDQDAREARVLGVVRDPGE